MRFQLLGQLGVSTETGEVDLGAPKQRSVLAVLLLNANEVVSTDRIIELVWGEKAPRTAEHSVQIYISELRKALANGSLGDLIDTRPPGYVINVPPDSVDTLLFERLVRDGLSAIRNGETAGGRTSLRDALDVWRGEPLADFAYEDFAQAYIRSLTELRSDALEALAELALDLGETDTARDLARQAIEADPLREEPRRVMMIALYRSGRQADALRHFGEYRRHLVEELGIEPSESLRQLEERVLLGDPTLELREGVTPSGNPYRGLRPFSEADADVYFGRETLIQEVQDRLAKGSGFVSIVGPSGSGKSSAARAGLIPRLREEGETVVVFQPGARPLWELAGAIDQAGFGSRATLLRRFENDASALSQVVDRSVVVIIDQFEELFTLSESGPTTRFAELIANAVRDDSTPLRVIVTLRADYYDKPLSIPALAGVFSDSIVSVKPMTPTEIERAVVEPAAAAGATVERGLLAQVVADMGDEPGALPLLQFTLFELFEASSDSLTLDDYVGLGGLHGALTGGADELLDELDTGEKDLAEQLMMRMIQKGRAMSTSRPVPVRDLLDMDVDTEALQAVLEAFGARRLITFDRDHAGAAVIEMAHEFLITEWPQMEAWIELHSEDLDRLYALDAAATEWVKVDKSEDYLLRGARLDEFEAWRDTTTLRLTSTEAGFIDASVEMRNREERSRAQQEREQATLQKRARRRLWYFGGAVAALAAAVTVLVVTLIPEPAPDVLLWAEARDGSGFSENLHDGLDEGLETTGLTGVAFPDNIALQSEVESLLDRGTSLVLMSQTVYLSGDVFGMLEEFPATDFILIDCGPEQAFYTSQMDNASCILSSHDEVGYLAGVIAGLLTTSNNVGIVVGTDGDFMLPFHTGFEDGATDVNPGVAVSAVYLTPLGDNGGYSSPTLGGWATQILLNEGSDVVFQAAGYSGIGVIDRVSEVAEETGSAMWSIGVDVDEHEAIYANPWWADVAERWGAHLATSIVKRLDVGISAALIRYAETGVPQDVVLTIENGGIDYVTTGGHIEHLVDELEAAKAKLIKGEVVLSTEPPLVRMLGDVIAP